MYQKHALGKLLEARGSSTADARCYYNARVASPLFLIADSENRLPLFLFEYIQYIITFHETRIFRARKACLYCVFSRARQANSRNRRKDEFQERFQVLSSAAKKRKSVDDVR